MLLLLIPTMAWTYIRVPGMKRAVEFLCLLPLAIPAIVLVVGIVPIYQFLSRATGGNALTLAFIDIILVLPYAHRAIDAGLKSIDVTTLAEAARSLGASWPRVMFQIIAPNMRGRDRVRVGHHGRARAGRVHDLVAAQLRHPAGDHRLLGKRDAFVAVAVSLAALAFAFVLVLGIAIFGAERRRKPRTRGGARHMTTAVPTENAARNGVSVQLLDLHRHYGALHALDGLTLELAPGELVALLGPSGCGKTTALRALAGLDEPDSGAIVVDGKDITHTPANRRDMGMVFQAYSLFPNMTARENVAYGLRLRGDGQADPDAHGPTRCSTSSGSASTAAATRTSCPAASSSASPSPGRSRSDPRCCCSTSRSRRSTPRSAVSCARRSGASRSRSAPRRCS